ncbi:Fanconi-associated nuclease 1 [Frankliniella fusca]|uniref:Fanconi-associated nuclease n=1 Tax=Frankliniella fusca TaxID=407009 RepID=A0AAE1I1L7_9NEOP|nr:Fanconi-associated nuclease 1 [Frankliniella fusca]
MVAASPTHHDMKECRVVLERLPQRPHPPAQVAVRECRVVLQRMDGGAVQGRAAPPPLRVLRSATSRRNTIRKARTSAPSSITVRKQTETGRLRSSAGYSLRERLFNKSVVMEVTRRSCWRRGRTRWRRPPPQTGASARVADQDQEEQSCSVGGGAGGAGSETGEDEHGAADSASTSTSTASTNTTSNNTTSSTANPQTGPEPSPQRLRLLCFKITIQAMVRASGGGGAASGFGELFADYEKDVLRSWLKLSDGAATTYLRLLGLRGPWVRGSALAAVSPRVRDHFAELERTGFVSNAFTHCDLSDVLALLRADEMEQVAVSLGVEFGRRTKLAMVRALGRLHASSTEQALLLQDRVRGVLGGCVRVLAVPRELVERALLAVAAWLPVPRDGDRLRAARTLLLQNCVRLLVPEGLPGPGPGPSQSMFTTRQQLLQWEAVANKRVSLAKAIASGRSTEVLTIATKALTDFRKHLESDTTTPAVIAIGTAMAELLDAASEALIKYADVEAAAAAAPLRALLEQGQFGQERRAAWAVHLATVLQARLGDHQRAAELLIRELEDGGHRGAQRCRLEERARTVLRGARRQGLGQRLLDETCARLEALLPASPEPAPAPEKDFRTVTVRATALPGSVRGMKRVFVSRPRGQQRRSYLSVEERVMLHFAGEYPRGLDDEGETLVSLAVLALWGAVYDAEVSGAWGSPLQDRPLDWATDSFWVARHLLMEQRLQDMERRVQVVGKEAASRALAAHLSEALHARKWTPSLVRWDLLQGLNIEELLKCLTVPVFVAICRRFFLDFHANRSGFPDLLLWNPDNCTSLFVDVKGPRDNLSAHQAQWLEFLQSHGAKVAVAVVQVHMR